MFFCYFKCYHAITCPQKVVFSKPWTAQSVQTWLKCAQWCKKKSMSDWQGDEWCDGLVFGNCSLLVIPWISEERAWMNMVQRGKQNATFGDPEFHDSHDFMHPFHAGNRNKSRFQVWLYFILRLLKLQDYVMNSALLWVWLAVQGSLAKCCLQAPEE